MFDNGQFVDATPKYLQLLNVEPKNHELNFKYGACLIYSAQDKSEAIRFLNFSVKNPSINHLAYYYLGKAFHLNFQFTNALTYYNKFKSIASSSELKKYNIKSNISACNNGKQLLTNITDMIVINKTEVKKEDFYELYELNNIGGSLLITDQFQTKFDKKMNHRPIIYFPVNSPYIFYSSYGEDGSSGLDIYVKERLPNGKWSNSIKVVGDVNTDEDEDYPYLSPDGKYLYYSSKGHNSMGGYDVFRSKVIIEGSSFSRPENMDFAISSPNDDILYIVDSLDQKAYFSSSRESEDGKLFVYEVRVEKIPMQIVVLKGNFTNSIDEGNKDLSISVTNHTTGEKIGEYNTNSKNGDVLLTLPKSGKYIFDMTVDGSDIEHRAIVPVPYLKELRPLKISILSKYDQNNEEMIVVSPQFDDKFDDPVAIMANVYQEISKLKPNSDLFNLDSLNNVRGADDVYVNAGLDIYTTPEDVKDLLIKEKNILQSKINENEKNSKVAHNLGSEKHSEAEELMATAKKLIDEASQIENISLKKEKLQEAYKISKKAIELNNEANQLISTGSKIENELKKSEQKNNELDIAISNIKAIDQNDRDGLTKFVKANSDLLVELNNTNSISVLDEINNEAKEAENGLSELEEKIADLKEREDQINNNISKLENQLSETKKQKEKDVISSEIESTKSELDLIENEISKTEKDINQIDRSLIEAGNTTSEILNNQKEEYLTEISNTQKLKIKYEVESQSFIDDISETNEVFVENEIAGEYASINNLSKINYQIEDYNSIQEIDDEIDKLIKLNEKTSDENQKKYFQESIVKLSQFKQEFVESEVVLQRNDILNSYNSELADIENIGDNKERHKEKVKLNESLLSEIKKVKKATAKNYANDESNETLSNELKVLVQLENDVKDEISISENIINSDNESDVTYENTLSQVNPNYNDRVAAIYNSDRTDEEKAEDVVTLNNSTLTNAQERIQELDSELSNGDDINLKKEKEYLTKLVKELEGNSSTPLVEPDIIIEISNPSEEVSKEQFVEGYAEKKTQIENSFASNLDKEKAKTHLNNELTNSINSELKQIDKLLADKPENAKILKARKENLEELKEEIEFEIKDSEISIQDLETDLDIVENSLESINSDYSSEAHLINGLSSDEAKKDEIIKLNTKSIQLIEKEIVKKKIAYKTNPKEEILYEIEKLETLKKNINYNIEEDYFGIVTFENEVSLADIKSSVGISDVFPEYQEELNRIDEEAISEKDLENKKIILNEELIAKIDQDIKQLEQGVLTNPDNQKQLNKRIQNLEEIKNIKEFEIVESQALVGETQIKYNIIVKVEELNPNYSIEMEEINNIEKESSKNKAIKSLNNETIQLLDDRMDYLINELKTDPSDQRKIGELQKLDELKAEIKANPTKVFVNTENSNIAESKNEFEFPVILKETSLDELVPGYSEKIDSVNESSLSNIEKENIKIELFKKTIREVEFEIKELETYLSINSPNKEYAENKKQNLKEIQQQLNLELKTSQNYLAEVEKPSEVYSGVNEIMPDYETRKEKIDYSANSNEEKLQKMNELNNVLVHEIDKEVIELENQIKAYPEDEFELNEKIEEISDLKKSINEDIEKNNQFLDQINPEDLIGEEETKTNPLNPENFGESIDINQKNLIKKDLKLIQKLEKNIVVLEKKKARSSDKDANKIQKQIDKELIKKSILHNRLIQDLEGIIDDNLWTELEISNEQNNSINQLGVVNDDVRNAYEGVLIAKEKISRAKELRKEAEEIKNPILANEKLKEAVQLESQALKLLKNSNRIYKTALVLENLTNENEVVVEVPSNVENRKSSQLYDLANSVELEADFIQDHIEQLRDSAETVKKKYKQAVLDIIEKEIEKEELLRQQVDEIRYQADLIEKEENELISSIPNVKNKELTNTDQVSILNSTNYASYYEEFNAGKSNFENAKLVDQEIESLKEEVSKRIKMAVVNGETVEDASQDQEVVELINKIDSLSLIKKEYKNQSVSHYNKANTILKNSSLDLNSKENMQVMANSFVRPDSVINLTSEDLNNDIVLNEPIVNTNNGTENPILSQESSSDFIPPSKLNGQIFRKTTSAVYSDKNPIPVDASQPEGLVYKVQVGAFRNPLPQEHFDKFAPISGQALNNGVTRYMVGYFTNYSPADNGKEEIHKIGGYNDAFVVAYYDGVRISISKAKEIEENGFVEDIVINNTENVNTNVPEQVNNTDSNQSSNTPDSNPSNTGSSNEPINNEPSNSNIDIIPAKNIYIKPKSNEEVEKTNYYSQVENAAPANQIEIIKGLFYTVQIGVYSNPVPASELFNVSPLNSQLTDNGKIRYSTGIYTSIEDASTRKNELINIGLVDAFVTAYFNGERISIAKSKELVVNSGFEIFTEGKSISESVDSIYVPRYNKENIYYRILIGQFENYIPSNYADYLFNDDNIHFESEIDADNNVYLYTQKFLTLDEVKKRLVEINELGFENMKIISYYNIQNIPFDEANKILNEEPIEELTELDQVSGIDVNDLFYEPDAIYYKIDLGTFDNIVPSDVLNIISKFEDYEFDQDIDEDGNIIVLSRNIEALSEANEIIEEIKLSGYNDSQVKAFHKYVQISLSKAKEIKGK